MEQWDSRWFTDEYRTALRKANCVWEFSKSTVDYLQMACIKAVYAPLGRSSFSISTPVVSEDIDVLFFGSMNDRRQKFITALQAVGLVVYTTSNVFGDARDNLIQRSKLVANIHYYEKSVTEQLRIIPCLARGKLVISENSVDQLPIAEYAGSISEFVSVCQEWLAQSSDVRRQRALELYQWLPEFKSVIPWSTLKL